MSFFGLAAYGSDDDAGSRSGDGEDATRGDDDGASDASASSSSSSDAPSSPPVPDAPLSRAPGPSSRLPSVADAFDAVAGPPAFLRPEATRAIAGVSRVGAGEAAAGDDDDEGAHRAREAARRARATVASRPAASTPVPAASASDVASPPDATTLALLGAAPSNGLRPKSKASAAADPAAFLAGDAATRRLPRKRGADDRVEAEKRKRANAQNGRGAVEWKSEAEMALRQQYD